MNPRNLSLVLGGVLLLGATSAAAPVQACDPAKEQANLCFVSPGGFLVEALTGQNGEFPVIDADGNSVFSYKLSGPGALGGSCAGVKDISHASILFPATCPTGALTVVSASPAAEIKDPGQGDPSCGFGTGDQVNRVLKWDTEVKCGQVGTFTLVLAGIVSAKPTPFSIKAGPGCSTGTILGPGCPSVIDTCPGGTNSTGEPAEIEFAGTFSISENNFKLTGEGVPPGNPAIFFMGTESVHEPFGNGFRCIGGEVNRLKKIAIFPDGSVEMQFDMTQPPLSSVVPGIPYYFQLFYRDPDGGGAGYNTSNSIAILFTP
jgi:hypothetical protein